MWFNVYLNSHWHWSRIIDILTGQNVVTESKMVQQNKKMIGYVIHAVQEYDLDITQKTSHLNPKPNMLEAFTSNLLIEEKRESTAPLATT